VKRFLLAAALALTLHGLFFMFGPRLMSQRSPATPRPLTMTFSTREAPAPGPGPEIEHPVPQPEEVSAEAEPKGEEAAVKEPPPEAEAVRPPEKDAVPRKVTAKPRPRPRVDVEHPKREATPPPKKEALKKDDRIISPSPPVDKPHRKEKSAHDRANVPPNTAGAAVEQRRRDHVGLLPDVPGSTGKAAPKAGGDAASVPSAGEIIRAIPAYRDNPRPEYPRMAKRRGYQGTVLLEVLVSRSGEVKDLRLLQSSGYHVLDRSAMKSVKYWLFEPGSIGGRNVDMWVRVPVRFELRER